MPQTLTAEIRDLGAMVPKPPLTKNFRNQVLSFGDHCGVKGFGLGLKAMQLRLLLKRSKASFLQYPTAKAKS